jgi:hypothetical protein
MSVAATQIADAIAPAPSDPAASLAIFNVSEIFT